MPNEWENIIEGDGKLEFDKRYNKETGFWCFQCSLKNYDDTIEEFFKILPYFIESADYIEVLYEEWEYSSKYELLNNEVQLTNEKFVCYSD